MTPLNCPGVLAFLGPFEQVPLWKREGDEMVCRDAKTGAEMQRAALPRLPCGTLLQVMACASARTTRDLILDVEDLSPEVHAQTRRTPTRSKRLLPAGSSLVVRLLPNGSLRPLGAHVRMDVPGQTGELGPGDVDFSLPAAVAPRPPI